MNKELYQSMTRGLIATIIEKKVVLGEDDAKKDVLRIVELLEDLDMFWNSFCEFDENTEYLQNFIETTREKYKLGGN